MSTISIGSVSVEVVPDARGFFAAFIAQTRPGAAEAGRKLGEDIRRGLKSELDRPADIKVRADTARARADVESLRNEVNRSSGSMIQNLLALSPALIPLGVAAAGAAAGFASLGGVAVLALTGIKREIDSATPNGAEFAGVVGDMKDSLHELQAVASRGVLTGFEQSSAALKAELPQLSQLVARQSVQLGNVGVSLTTGLVAGFRTFEPLIIQIGNSVERLAQRFAAFVGGPAGAKFGQTLAADYAKVAPIVDNVAAAISHLLEAGHGVGLGILTDLSLLSDVVRTFPTPVLQAMIVGFVAFRAATTIQGVANGITASFTALGARLQLTGLQAQSAAAQTTLANAQQAASAAAAAVEQTAAAEAVARAYLAEQEAIAASTASSTGQLSGLAAAAVRSAQVQVDAAVAASRGAIVAAEAQAAAVAEATAAQQASLARLAAAQRTASGGFASALGPIGLIAAGLLILPSLFDNSSDSIDKQNTSVQNYTQTLAQSSGVINDAVRANVAKSLSDDKVFETTNKLGIAQAEVTQAITQGGPAVASLQRKITDLGFAHGLGAVSIGKVNFALQDEAKNFAEAARAAKDQEAALVGAGSATGAYGEALANGNTALRSYVDAVKAFNQSANTAADRGKLIGEALRAANGDAISYQNTINATAKANQQLVTDFVNLKKGVLDLKTGTLDYHNAAAGPVLSDLQALQDANVKAAAAVYQHFVSTKGGAEAAGNAFDVYKKNTQDALTSIGTKLGLSGQALKKFTEQYFGIKNAGDLKKRIELVGQDKVVDALKGILEDLDILVGKKPLIAVSADGRAAQNTISGVQRAIDAIRQHQSPGIDVNTGAGQDKLRSLQDQLNRLQGKTIYINTVHRDSSGRVDSVTSGKRGSGPIARASGGYVSGPGSSTSDSIPARLSNGEFVVNAAQTKRNRGLLHAINSGAPGFAAGGEVGGYTGVDYSGSAGNGASRKRSSGGSSGGNGSASISYKLVGFQLDGTTYSTSKAARNAALRALKGQADLSLKIRAGNLAELKASAAKTGQDVADQFQTTFANLTKLGLNTKSPLAKRLTNENAALVRAVNSRNGIANKLKDTQALFADLAASAKDAITGSFDITAAGRGFDGNQVVTGQRILAEQQQAANRASRFVADIKALKSRGINGTYLKSLIEKGPDALAQADALLGLSNADLSTLNATQATINSVGAGLGTFAGNTFYGKSITDLTTSLRNTSTTVNRALAALSNDIRNTADKLDNRPVLLIANGKEIAKIVNTENAKNKRRK